MINFCAGDIDYKIKQVKILKEFINSKVVKLGYSISYIDYIFCTDKYIQKINQQFLQHNYSTDIITFPYHAKKAAIESNIYLGLETIKENSKQYKVKFSEELYRVIFHGVLHMCGYNDKSKQQQNKMTEAENQWLDEFNKFLNRKKVSRGTTKRK
jgi:probable rRNA maturation factor